MIKKALIVKQPWLELILAGRKTWEMRSRKTQIRGRVGLIESGSGLIVGEVDIVDSLESLTEMEFKLNWGKHRIMGAHDWMSMWTFPWVLENAERYKIPRHYDHPQGAVIWVNL